MCFDFLLQVLSETFLVLIGIQQDITIDEQRFPRKVHVILMYIGPCTIVIVEE